MEVSRKEGMVIGMYDARCGRADFGGLNWQILSQTADDFFTGLFSSHFLDSSNYSWLFLPPSARFHTLQLLSHYFLCHVTTDGKRTKIKKRVPKQILFCSSALRQKHTARHASAQKQCTHMCISTYIDREREGSH